MTRIVIVMTILMGVSLMANPPPVLKSPRHAGQMEAAIMVRASSVVVQAFELFWEYPLPLPRTNSGFTILYSTTVEGPYLPFMEADRSPVVVRVTGRQGFFKIKTHEL